MHCDQPAVGKAISVCIPGSLSAHVSAGSMLTLCQEFSASLTRLTHNLLATRLLSAPLQELLLSQLGLSPWQQGEADWPLSVSPRSLAVLAQVRLWWSLLFGYSQCLAWQLMEGDTEGCLPLGWGWI